MDNRSSVILLEDKELIGLNKVHKNVLKATQDVYTNKSKIYYDPSKKNEFDEMVINTKILDFASDGIQFDSHVVKSKALYAMPYSSSYVKEIFQNKKDLGNDFIIEPEKYKINEIKKINKIFMAQLNKEKYEKKDESNKIEDESHQLNISMQTTDTINVKFKPKKTYFLEQKLSSSETQLALEPSISSTSKRDTSAANIRKNSKLSKSLNNINETDAQADAFFLTELKESNEKNEEKEVIDENVSAKSKKKVEFGALKELENVDWDENLIDQLSEGTARWIAMKRVTDPKQKQKLVQIVEKKFGRYTRDIKDLELVEDNLTEFELRKIAEEKARLKKENEQIMEKPKEETEVDIATKEIPLYRLPHGIKQDLLEKINAVDPKYNSTAKIQINQSRIKSPVTYQQKMRSKNVSDNTLLLSNNPYNIEMISGHNNHVITQEQNTITLENGKQFLKKVQSVFPAEFTEWVSGITLVPKDRPDMQKPIKGRKKWKDLPELIDDRAFNKPNGVELNNFWHLMPTTPDTQLRKILKSNLTVAKVVEEWRRKWQSGNRWTLAEIEELIKDMNNHNANIRFQAVVVCSRAAEQIQMMLTKLENYNKKRSLQENAIEDENEKRELIRSAISMGSSKFNPLFNDSFFPENLFDTIENLLQDTNDKVKLAAAIAIFSILRKFIRPLNQKYQQSKDKAESLLRETLDHYSNHDRYASALCMSMDGYCDKKIVKILLTNYFNSNEQVTKEQVTKSLSDLSANHKLVVTMLEKYLKSEHIRERILACKMFPCLRVSPNKDVTNKLIEIMWNDRNRMVKKCAAQTLGRTGKGKEVHDEICNRINSPNSFDRYEALNKINHLGIMTSRLLGLYLKCFQDDYINVRELACKVAQNLFERNEKVIDALVFMSRFDKVTKIKALAIRTLGLIGDFSNEIRKCLIWAIQFERDPLIRTESCHSIILLVKNKKDQELVDILHERHLIEEEPIVRKEIMDALNYLGYDPHKELPIITKIKNDVKKLNDKQLIISKIKDIETKLNFEADKERFIWSEKDDADLLQHQKGSDQKKSAKNSKSSKVQASAPQPISELFEPTHIKIDSANTKKIDNIERISLFLEEANTIAKNKSQKVKSSTTSTFLSKLVLEKSDFLTSSVKSMNSSSDIASLEDFSSINKIDKKHANDIDHEIVDDDDDEQTSSIYYEDFLGKNNGPTSQQIHHNAKHPVNSDHLRTVQKSTLTNATVSTLKIDTILEESDI